MFTGWGINWLAAHQQWVEGVVVGWAVSHPAMLMRWAWNLAIKVPGLRQALLSNPEGTKAFAHALLEQFNREVDEEVAEEKAAQKQTPDKK